MKKPRPKALSPNREQPKMNELVPTRHGERRMRQRGMRNGDVQLVLAHATQVDDETWMLRARDAERAIQSFKRAIQSLERLRNSKFVIRDSRIVTAYSSRPSDQKRTLRQGRRKGLLA